MDTKELILEKTLKLMIEKENSVVSIRNQRCHWNCYGGICYCSDAVGIAKWNMLLFKI